MSMTFQVVNGDVFYNNMGQPATVSGGTKLGQDLTECTLSPVNDIGFGMGLEALVGTVQDPAAVPGLLRSNITNGITRFQKIQLLNQSLIRTNDELIAVIAQVSASPLTTNDKVDFRFTYAVNSVTGNQISRVGVL